MNEIAVVEQLPIITERIKEIGEQLDKRLSDLDLDNLVCNDETKKDIKNLRADLSKELKEFESQRKEIKGKIMEPYDNFNEIYEEEIKKRYQEADYILKTKIDEVESEIKHNTEVKMKDFFEEYRTSKNINADYLDFYELDIKIDLSSLTKSGELTKKVKDEIKSKVDQIANDLNSISTMQYSDEILVEYLKNKNLSIAIKEVNDRHLALDTMKRIEESAKETVELEEQVIQKVDEVLQAPTEKQISIDNFEENESEVLETSFKVRGTLKQLQVLKEFLEKEGYDYEPITD